MNLFCRRYMINILFILIHNVVVNFAINQTHKPEILTEVLTSFLKVPWVDLNSSGADAVASGCRDDIATLYKSITAGEMWALRMLDASSKIPSGILTGNIRDLGMFDECIKVNGYDNPANIQGQHCMVSMAMPTKFFGDISRILAIQKYSVYNPNPDVALSLTASVCLPSSCDELDINGLVNASIASSPELTAFEVSVAKVKCSGHRSYTEITLGSALAISFFVAIAILLLVCTACDLVLRARCNEGSTALQTAARFSLYTNLIKLSSTKSRSHTMPAINGIRIFTLCLIVFGHRVVNVFIGVTVNGSDISEMTKPILYPILFTLLFAVDTFFVLSGFLVSLSYLQMFRSGNNINILSVYLHRYLRLTPCIAVLLLFTIFIVPYFGSGPNWDSIYEKSVVFCEKNWWTNLLYVQNLVNPEEMCLLHTWYVAVEMQLFCITPFILYPLFYRPKLGLFILGLLSIAAFSIPAIQIAINQWVFFWDLDKSAGIMYSEFVRSYPMTYNRALPYLLGILLGYDVFHNKRQISRFQTALNWILVCLFLLFCVWTAHCSQPNGIVYDVTWEIISVSVARLGWSLVAAWTIYACTQGYGGPLTKLLSLPTLVPLARLTYSIYLVHVVLQVTITATARTAQYTSPMNVIYLFCGDMALSTVIALVLYLCIESPVYILEKILKSGRSPVTTVRGHSAKLETLSAAVKKYLYTTGSKSDPDHVIDTITSKLDFWQTVSDELNRLSKGPSRSPIGWSETWQDWRSELLNMDNMLRAESTGVSNKQFESRASVTAIEKELTVFLAAMNCSVKNGTSYRESEIAKSKSSSNFDNQRHGDSVRLSILDSDATDLAKRKFSGLVSPNDEDANSRL